MIVGAIDIGSNSVRLLIKHAEGDVVHRETNVTGLAKGVDSTGMLARGAVEETLQVMHRYRARLEESAVDRLGAVATSAMRDARNGSDVMAAIGSILGSEPEVISGEREASLAFAGASAAFPGTGSCVVVDIGGGSTEIVRGDDAISWAHSYDIGSVRLTDRSMPHRPAGRAEVRDGRDEVDRVLAHPPIVPRAGRIIGVAGTFTSLAAIHLRLAAYDPDAIHGTSMTRPDIEQLLARLAPLDIAETARIPSLEPGRAPVILAGTVIAAQVMKALGADEVIVSESDLLDGVADELLG